MRSQVILGLLGSILIHGGLIWGGSLMEKVKAKVKKEEPPPAMEVMAVPPQEPDTPDVTPDTVKDTDLSDLAPPSQMDVPFASVDNMFAQQIQPPPPPRFSKGGVITIPTGPSSASVGKGIGNVFDISNLDQRPEARFQPSPKFPTTLKKANIMGSATIQFIVDTAGDVRDPVPVKSTHREFETPAIEAVLKWKFRPGKKGSSVVNTRMEAEIEFKLAMDK